MVPDEVATFGSEVVASLQELLGDALVGAYYVGVSRSRRLRRR